jgi:hypothetical protein
VSAPNYGGLAAFVPSRDQAPMADGDGFVADLEGQPFDEAVVGVIPSRSRSQTTRSRGLHPPGRAEASRLGADAGSVGSSSIRVANLDRRGTIRKSRPLLEGENQTETRGPARGGR